MDSPSESIEPPPRSASRLRVITDPLNRTTTLYRDSLGRIIATQDPLGHRTLAQYDALDRITQTTDANGAITQYSYDANSNLTQILDPLGHAISYCVFRAKPVRDSAACRSRIPPHAGPRFRVMSVQ